MSEYIKKDSAIKSMTAEIKSDRDATLIAEMMLADVPEEDVIDVVRCKDCMWGNNKTRSGKRYCELSDMYEVDDGFCNWGEKIK